MLQVLKDGALCINVLSSAQKQQKRQGKLRRRICYKCKQHGHFIGDCPQVTGVLSVPNRSDQFGKPVRPVLATVAPQVHIKHNRASTASLKISKEQMSKNKCKASSRKIKSRLCYTCRSKGHESNECPNGNIPKSNLSIMHSLDLGMTRMIFVLLE
jgi:hypothetical protein